MQSISEDGVPCFNTYGGEVYLEKAFKKAGLRPHKRLPVAKKLGETCIQFLVHPTLSDKEMYYTCEKVSNVLNMASR